MISKAHEFIKHIEPWAVVLAVVFFVVERVDRTHDLRNEEQDRQYDRVVNSWQLLNSKTTGNSGKTQALEFLHRKGTPMIGLDLSGAYLGDLKYSNGHFQNSNLSNALLFRADLSNSILAWVDFNDAEMNDANLSGARASSCDFSGAILQGVNFENSDLAYGTFIGAIFSSSNLTNADLSNSDLTNANFNGFGPMYKEAADLTGTNLSNTNLSGADLSKVNLTTANLQGACGNFETLLPEGVKLYKTCMAATVDDNE